MTQELKERIARVFDDWCRAAKLRLHAGEMTAQEIRTVQAVLPAVKQAVLSLLPPQSVPEGWQLVPKEPSVEQLKFFGYAPGDYASRCLRCNTVFDEMDKRATRCLRCARKQYAEYLKAFAAPQSPVSPITEQQNKSEREAALIKFLHTADDLNDRLSDAIGTANEALASPPKPADELSNYAERTPITIRSSSVKPAVAEGVVERMKGIIRGWSIDIFADAIADRHINDLVSVLVTANLLRNDKEQV